MRVGMNMDREAESLVLFGKIFFYRKRMKLMLPSEKECARLALESVRNRSGISKTCGHGLYNTKRINESALRGCTNLSTTAD